ncbi:MAG: hypothetical protein Sapg2KO_49210 [Saprospiraceae bacterium]
MVKQDTKGNIWMTTFGGVFRYDGKSFTNVTNNVSSSRFFSLLEDSKGYLWFGSIGSGFYRYDPSAEKEGKAAFRNFTTDDGLASNEVVCIYEDKIGNIWFGTNGGASRYNGKTFQSYKMKGDSMAADDTWKFLPSLAAMENKPRVVKEVNSIIEDRTGLFWLGTREQTFQYDGTSFTKVTHDGQAFTNVRWIIEDKKGHIWLAGQDGLWRYDGILFTQITSDFVGYIYEDRSGNLWTSSQSAAYGKWVLSRYDEQSLSSLNPRAIVKVSLKEDNRGMIFGITEADDGQIWFGALDGVYRYDGKNITGFKKTK